MVEQDSKVIGYFAYRRAGEVVCTGAACVIAGSDALMRQYLRELGAGDRREHTVHKTRFGEIARGLSLGAAYAFDAQSYGRFEPLAKAAGLAVREADFAAAAARGERFVTVQLLRLPASGSEPT
jgi:hypothetical protein